MPSSFSKSVESNITSLKRTVKQNYHKKSLYSIIEQEANCNSCMILFTEDGCSLSLYNYTLTAFVAFGGFPLSRNFCVRK